MTTVHGKQNNPLFDKRSDDKNVMLVNECGEGMHILDTEYLCGYW